MITLTEGNDVFELDLTQDEEIDALSGDDRVTVIDPPDNSNPDRPSIEVTSGAGK